MKLSTTGRVRAGMLGAASICLVAGGLTFAAGTASAKTAKAGPAPLDHFLCYTASSGSFKGPAGTKLFNQLQPAGFAAVFTYKGWAHCNPANKVVPAAKFPAKNPLAHLLCMSIAGQLPNHKIQVHNQFGKGQLTSANTPSAFCLPSWKDVVGPPNMTPNAPPGLDHFTCYAISAVVGASHFVAPVPTKVSDEFLMGNYLAVKVGAAKQLCLPTMKVLVTGAQFPPQYANDLSLMCFQVSPTKIWPTVFDQNQFGQGPVKIPQPTTNERLCVPTVIDKIT